ncbi:aminotransferase class I/II-fold pyridoxal phosphate-dependent enzyme [Nitratidesulfovibrio sp.]|uniref:aminotransferase class I/II-fold pyridoxal phosphate-dependent enzyme n=1 Tax=Nitratidesulfovibrio sp. TaxID=2802297 RepID=UPI00333E4C44
MSDAGPPPHAAPALRPAVPRDSAPEQGTHGGEIYRVARELGMEPECITDHSSNGFAHVRELTRTLVEALPHPFEHYPDSSSTALREDLAAHEGFAPDNIMVGNGSSELIWLILRVLRPRRVTLLGPTFSEYARACEAHAIPWRVLHADPACALDAPPPDFRAAVTTDTDDELVVLCSPGNPCPVTAPDLPALVAALFRSGFRTVLADLTYRDFLWDTPEHAAHRHVALAPACPPSSAGGTLLCLHSFTKFFHCTGIRLGYLTGPENRLDLLQSRRPPWMVSPFAEAMGRRFLHALPDYRAHLGTLRADRAALLDGLRRSGVFAPRTIGAGPSFATCRLNGELLRSGITAEAVRRELLRHGMLIRSCDNIPGMPPGYLRMQVRRHSDNERLVQHITASTSSLRAATQESP